MADGRSKKVPDSSRARRGGEGFVAVAGFPFRRKEAGVRGRVRLSHLHDAPEGEGSEGEEGLWEGPEEPGQEHHADRRDHPPRGDGRADDRGGRHRLGGLRGLRGALPGPHPTGRTGGGARRAGAHRPKKIRELIEARGADLVFLPSYSPDLNPIEEAFSKVKALVRKEGVRLSEALVEAIGRALAAVTAEDAAGWFAHAGYWPQDQPM